MARWHVTRAFVALVAVLAVFPVGAIGWWDEGHMLVAQIALMQLDEARASVASAMVAELAPQFPATPDFPTAAVWPDDLKTMAIPVYNTLHYVTIPYNPDPTYTDVPPVQQLNVVWAIQQFSIMLNASATIPYGQQMAIRFLLHFCGDIHQPLHTISTFSPRFPVPNGDLGGNFFPVVYNGTRTNLHSVMDSIFYKFTWDAIQRPLSPEGRAKLEYYAREAMQLNPPESFTTAELTTLDPNVWAAESNALAIQYVYLNGTLPYNATLTSEYAATVLALLERRIALGGYRLGRLLNAYLPAARVPPVTSPVTACPSRLSAGAVAAVAIAALLGGLAAGAGGVYIYFSWLKRKAAYEVIPK